MPPITSEVVSGGLSHTSPFIGRVDHTLSVKVDISTLTTAEVDARGYLKPGVPLQRNGALISGSSQFVHAVTMEPIKIVPPNPTNTTLGAVTVDVLVACAVIGVVNRDIAEDVLGRAYNANELAAFDAAGSKIVLSRT